MLIRIPTLLSPDDLAQCRARLANAAWVDGRVTAGPQSAKVKENLQLPEDSAEARELGGMVLASLERSPIFISAALPRAVFPPLFNRYEPGMGFGAHVDNAIRQVGNTPHRIRTDISATLFISEPDEYDGGELIVEDTYGAHSVKLAAGDMVLYPSSSLHRVAPVTRGARVASFFWIQSLVQEDSERTLLFELDRAIAEIGPVAPDHPALVRLTACYHNLVRKWTVM
ncbi:MAG TPA: Fe2+-dependent dioxygenase [Rhizomicrobium sp.]|jgi:PKHD-type hydroxylase|nr:Fe2+-dependent dioxygenase [Rhizomicrobium sp.]